MAFLPRFQGFLGHHSRRRQPRKFRPVVERLEGRLALAGANFLEPPVITSNPLTGVLTAKLTMAVTTAKVGDTTVTNAWTYNGSYVGPTLKAQPGDLLDLEVVNRLPNGQITNLHTHGLHVSPLGNSDNVLLEIKSGASNRYQIRIPADHPSGLYWYHPHHHTEVYNQISKGLSGLLVIGDADGGATQLDSYTSHVLALKNALVTGNTLQIPSPASMPSNPIQTFTVNGQLNPVLKVPQGQGQVFNVANMGANAFYSLQLNTAADGSGTSIPLILVGQDGNPLYRARANPGGPANALGLPPGRRWSFTYDLSQNTSLLEAGDSLYLIGLSNQAQSGTNLWDVWPNTSTKPSTTLDVGTLNAAINATQTRIAVRSSSQLPVVNGFTITIGGEKMRVTAGAGTSTAGVTTWTVQRGVGGTTRASHSSGAIVALDQNSTNIPLMTIQFTPPTGPSDPPVHSNDPLTYTSGPTVFEDYAAQTTLTAAINATQTTIAVASATGFPTTNGYGITIGSENMLVTGGAGTTTWTVTRGTDGSTAAAQANAAPVKVQVAAYRKVVFGKEGSENIINGAQFGHNPIFQPRLGTVEEWTLLNPTTQAHPFHLHTNPQQVIGGSQGPGQPKNYADVINVPFAKATTLDSGISPSQTAITVDPASAGNFPTTFPFTIIVGNEYMTVTAASGPASNIWTVVRGTEGSTPASHNHGDSVIMPGSVTIRIKFTDYLGTIVFHCHRVDHEDTGMMVAVKMIPNAPLYAIGHNPGYHAVVDVFSSMTQATSTQIPPPQAGKFRAFPSNTSGVNVAVGDVNGDGVDDIIAGMGSQGSMVKVIDGTKMDQVDPVTLDILPSAVLGMFTPFGPNVRGVFVAAGDMNGDGLSDVIVGTGAVSSTAPPTLLVVNAAQLPQGGSVPAGAVIARRTLSSYYRGGVRVAAGDIAGNGRTQIVVGAGAGSLPQVQVYGHNLSLITSFLAFETTFRGGVFVATGNTKGCGFDDIIIGKGAGSTPTVKIFSDDHATKGLVLKQRISFMAYGASNTSGVRVSSRRNIPSSPTPVGFNKKTISGPYGGNWDDVVTVQATGLDHEANYFDVQGCETGPSPTPGGGHGGH